MVDILKDYDYEVIYRPCKANMVADTLSQRMISATTRNVFLALTVLSPLLDLIKGLGLMRSRRRIASVREDRTIDFRI